MGLYNLIKYNLPPVTDLIPDGTKVKTKPQMFNQTMREDVPGDVGVYLYQSSNDLKDIEGDIVYRNIKATVLVNGFNGDDGMELAYKYLERFVDRLENPNTSEYLPVLEYKGTRLIQVEHQGPVALAIGHNDKGLTVYRCVMAIKYSLAHDK